MKQGLVLFLICCLVSAKAQLTEPPEGDNRRATVSENIGVTQVTISYNRPGVKGREGKIWGQLVHIGFTDLQFGTSGNSPWRAGANENTTIEFSTDVKVEGKDVKAGRYGLFLAYHPENSTLILSRNAHSWGSYFYKESDDVLRVNIKPQPLKESVEWLKYEFMNQTRNSAVIALQWEKLMFPFKVETDLHKTQMEVFRNELETVKSFSNGWRNYVQAARYSLENNVDLEQGLKWADLAISGTFIGEANFNTLSTKADLLEKLNRQKESDSLMRVAMTMGSAQEVHNYGMRLLRQGRMNEATSVFESNYKKFPDNFYSNVGMARVSSAKKDYKSGVKFARKAVEKAPNENLKKAAEGFVSKLEKNENINQ